MSNIVAMGDIVATRNIVATALAEDKNKAINGLQLLRKEVVPGVEKNFLDGSFIPLCCR